MHQNTIFTLNSASAQNSAHNRLNKKNKKKLVFQANSPPSMALKSAKVSELISVKYKVFFRRFKTFYFFWLRTDGQTDGQNVTPSLGKEKFFFFFFFSNIMLAGTRYFCISMPAARSIYYNLRILRLYVAQPP